MNQLVIGTKNDRVPIILLCMIKIAGLDHSRRILRIRLCAPVVWPHLIQTVSIHFPLSSFYALRSRFLRYGI